MATESTRLPQELRAFPFPFGGISDHIWYPHHSDFKAAVRALVECGHQHNYAVQGDGQIIYTTASGIDCLRKAHRLPTQGTGDLMNEDMVLVLGDTHGSLKFIEEVIVRLMRPHGVNLLHVVGDFGYWAHTRKGVQFLDDLDEMALEDNILVTFTDGNHENFDLLHEIPISDDGWRRVRDRIWHAPRGHTWEWGNTRFLSLGGANSIDGPDGPAWWKARMGQGRGLVEAGTPIWNGKQFIRFKEDIDLENWWPQENVTRADVDRATEASQGLDVDVMFTHDCPEGVNIPGIHGYPMGDENRMLIRKAMDAIEPTHLIHGHYHKWVRDQLNSTEIVGLAHDGGKNGQYIFIETNETNVIIPEW